MQQTALEFLEQKPAKLAKRVKTPLLPFIVVLQAHDIILAQVAAYLHLD